ncbi:MAG: hypothetical protein WEE66_12960 [Actinomycetota bacterium]
MTKARGTDRVHYGPPGSGKGMVTRSSQGRHCEEPGCTTVLSTYNASSTCWLHTGPALKHPLARS